MQLVRKARRIKEDDDHEPHGSESETGEVFEEQEDHEKVYVDSVKRLQQVVTDINDCLDEVVQLASDEG